MPDLLLELFSEEIPARMQKRACDDLKARVTDGLVEAGLTYADAAAFATPRRLALAVHGLTAGSPTLREERKGPRVDAPEKALEGFLRSTGLTRDQLEARDDKKGRVWFAVVETPGRPAAQIVAEVVERVIRSFPWPKSMRWGAGSLRWVRPLHSILCILSDESGASVVDLDIDGIRAGDTTRGHRFMAPEPFSVTSFEDYEAKLRRTKVILNAEERADHIWIEAHNAAFAQGLEIVEDKGLLAEVAGLVEWPVVLMGEIGEAFLDLPPEVLQTSMREHQKFFSVRDPKAGQIVKFVTVANRETADDGATILAGNGRVLAARLGDAKFFWENDLRVVRERGLSGMAEGLAAVTFHSKLGSQADRVARITALAREIAPLVGAKPDLAAEAAGIAKADLVSEMVYEFPELQGIMGRYYAQAAGHDDGVPEACEEHYKPLGPGDSVPTAPVSVAVALADKIDMLTGFWVIDEKPTGSKDPYALRRAALGVIRLVLGNDLSLKLGSICESAFLALLQTYFDKGVLLADVPTGQSYKGEDGKPVPQTLTEKMESFDRIYSLPVGSTLFVNTIGTTVELGKAGSGSHVFSLADQRHVKTDLLAFLHDRLKVHLRDEGIRHDVIDAVLAMPGSDDLTLVVKRAEALSAFLKTDDGENLLQGFKRANNILTQAEEQDGVEYSFGPEPKLAEDATEKALFAALDRAEAEIAPAMQTEDFAAAMSAMAGLRAPIDAFFEAVQINTDNQIVRRNRLNLLHRIRATCLEVADLTRISG
ncbi:glycine--tRNA ligase subunit beta [Maritimibacter sp. 55A14]|uniref:glycine--tRNA ligase subunit beta n=1 Tax=Maritimibacter sp. 55A14 TaxID=2174844 RepID=UPI000D611D2D|nr:glycine--tRNA ligase subunit beta [Maritimibacter sp. 55A14]PWE33673.1 glycine--tRNA ligase subunit beta [Maritimibacter sp. 55A14]